MADLNLYAWRIKMKWLPVHLDHTFVTDYEVNGSDVSGDPNPDFWYCYGAGHDNGETAGQGKSVVTLDSVSNISEPNKHSGTDGQQEYGTTTLRSWYADGKCHQAANQILFCIDSDPPVTIDAVGNWLTSFLYGTYGLRPKEWVDVAKSVRSDGNPSYDVFYVRAKELIGDNDTLQRLEDARAKFHKWVIEKVQPKVKKDHYSLPKKWIHRLNRHSEYVLAQAYYYLGGELFWDVFDLKSILGGASHESYFESGESDIVELFENLAAAIHNAGEGEEYSVGDTSD
ncbi:MAG: hypothetical protein P4M00_18110 [Azospirillaceae bacterium]|nr:hypothetical protein [Azospirillaceae bacterium]